MVNSVNIAHSLIKYHFDAKEKKTIARRFPLISASLAIQRWRNSSSSDDCGHDEKVGCVELGMR